MSKIEVDQVDPQSGTPVGAASAGFALAMAVAL